MIAMVNPHRSSHILLEVVLGISSVAEWVLILSYFSCIEPIEQSAIGLVSCFIVLNAIIDVFVIRLIVLDLRGRTNAVRWTMRILVTLLAVTLVFEAALFASIFLALGLMIQLVCVLWYQMETDPCLDRHAKTAHYKGFIPLSFFNLFWIFIICCFVGLVGETVVSAIIDGRWESRAGFVWGPFSSIYGVGGVFITVALNRLQKKNVLVLWLVAGLVGGAFELLAGFLLESVFGIVAWSYTDRPFNIHGYTCSEIAVVWGFLGVLWMKAALPALMKLIDLIPLSWRTPLTIVFGAFILVDAYMTATSLNYWFERRAGVFAETPVTQFYAHNFGDEFMQTRFETMSMYIELAKR